MLDGIALRDLVPFVPFKKRENQPWRSVTLVTLLHGCFPRFLNSANGTNSRKASHIVYIMPRSWNALIAHILVSKKFWKKTSRWCWSKRKIIMLFVQLLTKGVSKYWASVLKWILTHFSPMFYFYTPWKRQKTFDFLTFSMVIDMKHWFKMD